MCFGSTSYLSHILPAPASASGPLAPSPNSTTRCVVAPKDPVTGAGQDEELKAINSGDTAWMLISAAIVLIMTPGECQDVYAPRTGASASAMAHSAQAWPHTLCPPCAPN